MHYVYVLESLARPAQTYVGYSLDVDQRLKAHNHGQSTHTNKFKPWKLLAYFAFETELIAKDFERYLKTASGKAFMNKRLIPNRRT